MKLNIPLYNRAGLRELSALKPFLRPDDTLMLVSGNVDKALDIGWLETSLEHLATEYPQNVLLATAGLGHLEQLAAAELPNAGLVYIYEPGFANVPEFSWDADATLKNLVRAADLVHTHGSKVAFKPTGRPLFQNYLFKHGWDYGTFAEGVDLLLVQTQTYCKGGNFTGAAEKLGHECAHQLAKTYVQITLDPAARNGVSPEAAASCVQTAAACGFAGVTAWGSPRFTEPVVAFLKNLRPDFTT